jgi:thymidylate kinase
MREDCDTECKQRNGRQRRAVILLSFSGIDGAGKTTQIKALQRCLSETGSQILLLSFWDDIAALRHSREELGHSLFGGDRGVGCPDKPLNRRDKNVRSWYMTVARLFFYSLDTICLNRAVTKARRSGADVVIFDRYIYDEFANLLSCRGLTRIYLQLLLSCTPKPDIAYLLDADPQLARQRKPEYLVGFLTENRESYLALSELAGMIVIHPLPVPEVSQKIMEEIEKRRSRTRSNDVESFKLRPTHALEESMKAGTGR